MMAKPKRGSSTLISGFMNAIKPSSKLEVPVQAPYQRSFGGSSAFLPTTSLLGKVAVVTGSSRSTGAAVARCLGEHGASVVVNYVTDDAAASAVVQSIKSFGKGGAIAVKANTATIEGGQLLLDEALKVFGRIDILVLNAGVMGSRTLGEVDEAFWDVCFETNVKVPVFMCKKAAEVLPSPGGRIIFFSSSLTASSTILPNALPYLATKGAVEQISRVLAKDLGARGITVNTISPGPIDTPLFREGKTAHVLEGIAKQTPQRRLGEPEDVAPMVAFLASDAAAWVNGQNLRVDGGYVV